jgi:hypothetical protein
MYKASGFELCKPTTRIGGRVNSTDFVSLAERLKEMGSKFEFMKEVHHQNPSAFVDLTCRDTNFNSKNLLDNVKTLYITKGSIKTVGITKT